MALRTDEIRRFLLGTASDAEHKVIEMRMSEEEFDRDIAIAENELIEEYLEGALPDEEKELFEHHYLSSDKHRDLVNELKLLKRYSSGPAEAYLTGETRAVAGDNGPSPYKQLASAAVIVVIGLLGLLSWRMFQAEQRPPLEQRHIELNAGDLSDLTQYPSMVLMPAAEIRPSREPRFRTEGPGTSFLFRMPVSGVGPFDANLSVNGREVFAAGALRAYPEGDVGEVRLLVPREAVAKGKAEIVLTGAGGSVAYPFIAE